MSPSPCHLALQLCLDMLGEMRNRILSMSPRTRIDTGVWNVGRAALDASAEPNVPPLLVGFYWDIARS